MNSEQFTLTPPDEPPPDRKRKETPKRGHAWTPGTGPEGETCRTCRHLFRNRLAKTYLKCSLMHRQWTGGQGTDIRAKDAVCKFWGPARDD